MVINYSNNLSLKTINKEKIIYSYLREYTKQHSIEETIAEFRYIFLEGISRNLEIRNTIEDIISSQIQADKFFYILNHSLYIIIAQWFSKGEQETNIIELLKTFENIENASKVYSRKKRKIFSLVRDFLQSDYYKKINRIIVIFEFAISQESDRNTQVIHSLPRYSYLYKSLLIGKENTSEINELVKEIQLKRNKSFELKLAQHIIYRTRLVEIAKARQFSHGAGRIIRRCPNPTLLSNKELRVALKQYIRKIDKKVTLHRLALKFTVNCQKYLTYREFKRNLYFYLVYQIEPKNNNCDFKKRLWQLLDGIYYQSDMLPLTDSLILRTCRKLYSYLVINKSEKQQHNLLIKFISTLGTAQTVMLLIKIVLICPSAKPYLEQKLATLYSCYELKNHEHVPWLLKLLEHFSIAFAIYFGKIDISLAKRI